MSIEELVNKGIQSFGNPEKFNQKQKTLVVIGVARGGTSLVAGVVDALGIFTGERSKAPVYEDITLSEAFEANNKKEIIKTVNRYNSSHDIWLFKRPSSINYLHLMDRYLRNPIYLVVFKDIFAIANRNSISMQSNSLDALNQAHKDYAKILKYFTKREGKINGVFYSYDKVMQNRSEFIDSLIELIGKEDIDKINIQKAYDFIDPNSKAYLDATRITKSIGQITKIDKTSIEGWAKFLHSSDIAEVELLINGKVVSQSSANQKSEEHKNMCGFKFQIETPLSQNDIFEVKVIGDIRHLEKMYKKPIKSQFKVDFEKIELNNTIKNDVLIAEDGWLFLFQGGQRQFDYLTGKSVATKESVHSFVNNIQDRIAYCKEKNIVYHHIVFPSKPLVKIKFLDKNLQNIKSLFERDYFDELKGYIPLNFDKFFSYPLNTLKELELTKTTFLKLDTHMNHYGYHHMANRLLHHVGMNFKLDKQDFVHKDLGGDLSIMLNSSEKYSEELLVMNEQNIYEEDNKNYLLGNTNNLVMTHCKDSKSSLRLLIFGDNFFKHTLKFLRPFFKDILYVRSSFVHYEISELYQPDVIFTGNAERYLSNVKSDKSASNFLLDLYEDNSYQPSINFLNMFKAQLSYAHYPQIYDRWVKKIEDEMTSGLSLNRYHLNEQIKEEKQGRLKFISTGRDPYLIYSSLNFQEGKRYLFNITYMISEDSFFQLFYTDSKDKVPHFSENNSLKQMGYKGINSIEMILDYPTLGEWLRIDPMTCEGEFEIRSLSLEELSS